MVGRRPQSRRVRSRSGRSRSSGGGAGLSLRRLHRSPVGEVEDALCQRPPRIGQLLLVVAVVRSRRCTPAPAVLRRSGLRARIWLLRMRRRRRGRFSSVVRDGMRRWCVMCNSCRFGSRFREHCDPSLDWDCKKGTGRCEIPFDIVRNRYGCCTSNNSCGLCQ